MTNRSAPVGFLFFLLCCLSAGTAFADLVKLKTDTSLRGVYFVRGVDTNLVRVQPVFIAGEADFDGPEGLSHYLEHIMYWHADKVNDQPYHARSGNAWVNGLITTYYNEADPSELDDVFAFAGRLLTRPTLDRKFMLDERKVVMREYDLRISENPDRRVWGEMQKLALPGNPVSRSVIGTPETIGSLTLEHAMSFHEKFYNASNLVLLVSGNTTAREVVRRVNATFGPASAGPRNPQSWRSIYPSGKLDNTISFSDRFVTNLAFKKLFAAEWTGGDEMQDSYTAWLLAELLNSALDGGFGKPLRMDDFIIAGYDAGVWATLDGQIQLSFEARPDEGVTLEKLAESFEQTLQQMAKNGLPEGSIERVRERLLQTERRLRDDIETILNRALSNLSAGLPPNYYGDHIRRIKAVTKADMDSMLRALAKADRKVSAYLTPNAISTGN